MKVLIADKFEQSGLDGLHAAGCEVEYQPDLKDEALQRAIAGTGADVLVVRGTRVSAEMIQGGRLSLIVRAGAGYNTIDVAAASASGIYVSNCPGKNAVAVAELAFGLILALDRRIPDNVDDLRRGRWNKKEYSRARGLFGRTLGLIGYGSIGHEMARRAHGFGMRCIVWSRRFERDPGAARADDGPPITLAARPMDVAAAADILSVHLALAPETRDFVGDAIFSRMKSGAVFINTARAEVVDDEALRRAVELRGIRAGLDVFAREPVSASGEFDDPIVRLPGVYGTHHIGGSTDQAQEAIAEETVRVIEAYKNTGKVPNVVNLAKKTPATHTLIVRHRDKPGVLAHVFECLRSSHMNVQETDNIVFEGAQAAVARINVDRAPDAALLDDIRKGNADVLDVRLVQI